MLRIVSGEGASTLHFLGSVRVPAEAHASCFTRCSLSRAITAGNLIDSIGSSKGAKSVLSFLSAFLLFPGREEYQTFL